MLNHILLSFERFLPVFCRPLFKFYCNVDSFGNGESSIFLLPIFFATQIIGVVKELEVLL